MNASVDINYIMDLGYGYRTSSFGSTQSLLLNVDLMIDKTMERNLFVRLEHSKKHPIHDGL